MKSNYYTSIEIEDGNYVGTVYTASANQLVYKSKPYLSQSQAMQDIHTYLATLKPPTIEPVPKPQVIVNTTKHVPGALVSSRRCCGR